MRTPFLATLWGLSLVACAGQIEGGGVDIPENCGNGQIDEGEACDDGNLNDGDGCTATCQAEAVPRIQVTLPPTVTTDLLVSNTIDVMVTGFDGFEGQVTLAASILDSGNLPIADWSPQLLAALVNVPLNGTDGTALTLKVPGDTASLAGTLKITATSALGTVEAMSNVTANPVAVITYTTNGNNCAYPIEFPISNPVRIKANRLFKVVNASATLNMQIHFDGGAPGINHQGAFMAAGASYDQTPTANNDGANVTFYCHDANATPGVDALDPPNSANLRQRLVVVD